MADELDSVGLRWRPAAPSFFLRTSNEVCDASVAAGGRDNAAVFRTHAARIENPRLRRGFQAAVSLQQTSEPQRQSTKSKRREGGDYRAIMPASIGVDQIFLASLHAMAKGDARAIAKVRRDARREWSEIDQFTDAKCSPRCQRRLTS
jgi:hypothetical protein